MEKFLGKFKLVPELTEGQDAYFTAMQTPDATREAIKQRMQTLVAWLERADGEGPDSYLEVNDYWERLQGGVRLHPGRSHDNHQAGRHHQEHLQTEGGPSGRGT
ncbi:uncharacterized protein LOC143289516 [Babylonia areolata]|uniref:uncharacterized protein LOC143289516 n=1 Tax=Babylonia areolata TaxID=304850 RepID=UPI003FD47896